jgi:hypothetical protein
LGHHSFMANNIITKPRHEVVCDHLPLRGDDAIT